MTTLRIAIFTLFTAASCPVSSGSQSIDLHCEGAQATHHNGFGRTEVNWNELKSRLVSINERAAQARMQTLFGERTVALETQSDDRYFSLRVPLELEYQGRTVLAESVLINRVTGEISSQYELAPLRDLGNSFLSFSGKCKLAQRLF